MGSPCSPPQAAGGAGCRTVRRAPGRPRRRRPRSPASAHSSSSSTSRVSAWSSRATPATGARTPPGPQLPYLDKLTVLIVPDQNTEALPHADGRDRPDGERRNPARRLCRLQAHRRAGPPPADRRRRRARSQRAVVQPVPRWSRRTRAARGSGRKPSVRPSPVRPTGRASSTPCTSARRSPSTDRLPRQIGCGIPSRGRRAIAIRPKRASCSPRPA